MSKTESALIYAEYDRGYLARQPVVTTAHKSLRAVKTSTYFLRVITLLTNQNHRIKQFNQRGQNGFCRQKWQTKQFCRDKIHLVAQNT